MRPQYFPVTDDVEDAPDGAEVYIPEYHATYKRVGMSWELKEESMKPRYDSKGWPLCQCTKCGRLNYVEPHGTTAACRCTKGEWTEHKNIPYNTPGVSNQ